MQNGTGFEERQLFARLFELRSRLDSLTEDEEEEASLSETELRYVLPEDILSGRNLRRAVDLAVSDLRSRYGIEAA